MARPRKGTHESELRQQVRQLRRDQGQWQQEKRRLQGRLREVEKERERLRRRVEKQEKQIEELKAKLEEARRAAKRQAAPFRRRRRKKDPHKPGRKPGHAAAQRERPPKVDKRVFVPLCGCPHCGGAVREVRDLEPQVVIDVPEPVAPQVTEYINQSGWCAKCHKRVQSRHKDQHSQARGAAGVQVGPRALALAMDLRYRVGLVFRKVAGVLELLLGIYVCAGALVRAAHRVAKRCEPTVQVLIEELREAPVVHADETGWYVMQVLLRSWLWVFTAPEPKITVYVVRQSRGSDVPWGVLTEEFGGVLVVDGWAAYGSLPYPLGQCLAHLLRRCWELLEVQKQGAARVAHAVLRILQAALALVALRHQLAAADYWAAVAQLRGELRAVLEGRIEDPANLRLVKHLARHEDELWTFLAQQGVAPTNNLAEQEVRPGVLLRKLSAGNRTEPGAHTYEVLATVSRTAVRNGLVLADVLPELLCSTDTDHILPLLTAGPLPCRRSLEEDPRDSQGSVRSDGTDLRRPGGGPDRCAGAAARPPPPS